MGPCGARETRYQRQVLMPTIRAKGQRALANARVAVVGAGGLGAPNLSYLAAAGVGHVLVIDSDIVNMSNLNRQVLFRESDIGESKAKMAQKALQSLNSEIRVRIFPKRLSESNVDEVLSGIDLIIDAVDNLESRRLVNRFALKVRVPVIFAAVEGLSGTVLLFDPNHEEMPCYECVFPHARRHSDGEISVLGATAGVVGSWQAAKAIKYLCGDQPRAGVVTSIDLERGNVSNVNVTRRSDCSCSDLRGLRQ